MLYLSNNFYIQFYNPIANIAQLIKENYIPKISKLRKGNRKIVQLKDNEREESCADLVFWLKIKFKITHHDLKKKQILLKNTFVNIYRVQNCKVYIVLAFHQHMFRISLDPKLWKKYNTYKICWFKSGNGFLEINNDITGSLAAGNNDSLILVKWLNRLHWTRGYLSLFKMSLYILHASAS